MIHNIYESKINKIEYWDRKHRRQIDRRTAGQKIGAVCKEGAQLAGGKIVVRKCTGVETIIEAGKRYRSGRQEHDASPTAMLIRILHINSLRRHPEPRRFATRRGPHPSAMSQHRKENDGGAGTSVRKSLRVGNAGQMSNMVEEVQRLTRTERR